VITPAIVGRFNPDAKTYQARAVARYGEPTWMLGQLALMWSRSYDRDAAALCTALLGRDWWELAHVHAAMWHRHPGDAEQLIDVTGLGRGLRGPVPPPLTGTMPSGSADPGPEWAYLWEHAGGALHVYANAHQRWHHLATLPIDLLNDLNITIPADIEARLGWLEDDA
jgi:hypothetical protein